MKKKSSALAWQSWGAAVLLVGALVALSYMVFARSFADDSSQSAGVANAVPTVDTVVITTTSGGSAASAVTLTENTTTRVYVRGTATDNNGCSDVDTASEWTYVLYRTNLGSGGSCTANGNNCYRGDTANLTISGCSGAGDLTVAYEGYVDVYYYADPTDSGSYGSTTWTAGVLAGDESGGDSSPSASTTEINSLTALNVSASVDYGTVTLGGTSTQASATVSNTGNTPIDGQVSSAGDFVCSGAGSSGFTSGQVEWSLTNNFSYGAGTDLSTTPTSVPLNLAYSNNGGAASQSVFFLLQLPSTGLRGTCTNTVTFTAVADA